MVTPPPYADWKGVLVINPDGSYEGRKWVDDIDAMTKKLRKYLGGVPEKWGSTTKFLAYAAHWGKERGLPSNKLASEVLGSLRVNLTFSVDPPNGPVVVMLSTREALNSAMISAFSLLCANCLNEGRIMDNEKIPNILL
jgi:hypothetical protein